MDERAGLRAHGRSARASLAPAERAAATEAVVGHLLSLPEVQAAERVLLTAAVGHELDLGPAHERLRAAGVTVALPVTRGDELLVVDHPLDGAVRAGWRGVPEPTGPPVDGPLDVVVAPGLVLDRRGGRLGYGGGHFDRFLAAPARADALRVGAVFACQLVDAVPLEPHDVLLDVVVTEDGVLRTGARAH